MIDPNLLCMRCMSKLTEENGVCPNCGFDNAKAANEPHQLECRSILAGAYLVGCVLGQGGFGITYTGWDLNLDLKIAIKEYYPLGYATRDSHTHISVLTLSGDKKELYQKGLERFVNEAKTLAKISRDNGIVGVRNFIYENGTAYIIMDFVEGETLKSLVDRRGGKLPAQEVLRLFRPLLTSLAHVHAEGLLHRDISPDNIILRPNGTLTLIDFGSARQISASGEHSNTINVKHGFAPEEQYRTHGEQGPWTDVYGICATMYRLMTGQTPPQALDRLTSGAAITPPRQLGADLTPAQESAILHGLGVNAQYRTRDMQSLEKELYADAGNRNGQPIPAVEKKPTISGPIAPKDPFQKPADKKGRIKTIAIIAGSAVAIYLLILLGVGAFGGDSRDKKKDDVTVEAAAVATATPEATATPTPTATPKPTKIPNPADLTLKLDFGETFLCSVKDFSFSYDISDDDVQWTSSDSSLVDCTKSGMLSAGYMQVDIEKGYNDPVEITGVAPNGVTFTYEVSVGNGKTYAFEWASSPRVLKDSIAYMYIAKPAILNCKGFTLGYIYNKVSGKHKGDWVLWVRDTDGGWHSIPNLKAEDGVATSFDVTFDTPIDIAEMVVQPVNEYTNFTWNDGYLVGYVIFGD
ncbi:MAG: serine/threonine-protein kinase [Eubacteriales bacterium]|nr:serine/threonine-protein kinase [Eubacteriales bacterium]